MFRTLGLSNNHCEQLNLRRLQKRSVPIRRPLTLEQMFGEGRGGILPELFRQETFIVKNSICWKLQKLILPIRCNPYFGANCVINEGRVAFGNLYRPEACVRKDRLGDFSDKKNQCLSAIHLLYILYMIVERC